MYGINGSDEFVASPFALSVVNINLDDTGSYATFPKERNIVKQRCILYKQLRETMKQQKVFKRVGVSLITYFL